MSAAFVPRRLFPNLSSLPRSYFLGHHRSGLSAIRKALNDVDLVVECRDSRVPISSVNPLFEEILAGRQRLIVFTKRDLGFSTSAPENEKLSCIRQGFAPNQVFFSNAIRHRQDVQRILTIIKTTAERDASPSGFTLMVVGMPNVGKSSLLNALRYEGIGKGKAAFTGAQPGITRTMSTRVKLCDGEAADSNIYIHDTPGVFMTSVQDPETMLKLAVCGIVKDTVIDPVIIADYLLYRLNLRDPRIYTEYSEPTNDITTLLERVAERTGRLQKGGSPAIQSTALWFVQRWRNGHLGTFLLDDVLNSSSWASLDQQRMPLSLQQARRAAKKMLQQQRGGAS